MGQSSAEQMRAWIGPAIFSFGFRPFFLFGAGWAALSMLIWIAVLVGGFDIPSRFDPISWHAHAFLFGYLNAIVAGFLLTAVPNWTGRLPIVGWRLAALFALWGAGRVAVFSSTHWPIGAAAMIDLAFPICLGGLILREIIAGKNWRNLMVLALLGVFTLGNVVFHIEAARAENAAQGYGLRLGLATAIMMIAVIGGRIIPSFTRNWLAGRGDLARPTPPMTQFDKLTLLISIGVLIRWVLVPASPLTALALMAFGLLHLWRLARWQGHRTLAEPLVWVLHIAYLFIPLGAMAMAADELLGSHDPAAAQHIWMAGAIGGMTLAVMTRATLGHSGQKLLADKATVAVYICLFLAVVSRLASGVLPGLLNLSALLWIAAFLGFTVCYGPSLLRPKPKKTAGS